MKVAIRTIGAASLPTLSASAAQAEAAHVINELVKPASVVPSHANEVAPDGGKAVEGCRTDIFVKEVKAPVHLPLSGRTMKLDSKERCMAGC